MRTPRPTIAFLKSLPIESFTDPIQRKQIANRKWTDLEFDEVQHPLVDDARRRFSGGNRPDQHRSSTKAARRAVFELRDPGGAGWRGAVVLDDAGDPWIVFAEKHNRFHDRAAEVLKVARQRDYLPMDAEYKLRDREDAARADCYWRAGILEAFLSAVRRALNSGQPEVAHLPESPKSSVVCGVSVELDHDSADLDEILDSGVASTFVDVGLVFPAKPDYPLREAAIQEIVGLLRPQPGDIDSVYGRNDELHTSITISQARLAQLVAATTLDDASCLAPPDRAPMSERLHYVASSYLAEAFVYGKSVRAVCGEWFVPTRDESAGFPVCGNCENERPIAQAVVDLIQRRISEE